MISIKRNYSLSSTPVTAFLIAEKLQNLWLYDSEFQFISINSFVKNQAYLHAWIIFYCRFHYRLKSIAFLYPKKLSRGNLTLYPRQRLSGQNVSVQMSLIECIKPRHWISSHFLKVAFHKLFFTYYCCVEQNLLFKKLSCILNLFDFVLGGIQCYCLSSTRGLEHFSHYISNDCQKVSSRTGSKANIS